MKKIFLVKRNALLSSTDISWGMYALLVAILVLFLRFLAPNLFWHIFTPVFRGADILATGSHTFINSFSNTARLASENERLVNENVALSNENHTLLQKVAGLGALHETPGILAGIVARPPESPYDTLVLAGGSRAGITLGQEVFGPGNVPLGIVSSVLADFTRVTLFSAPGMTTNGWIGRAALPLIIRGAGAGALQASLSRSAGVVVGDIVFAPGPGMLPLGSVVRIDSDPSAPGVSLHIMPMLNLFSLAWVELRSTGIMAFVSATSTLP